MTNFKVTTKCTRSIDIARGSFAKIDYHVSLTTVTDTPVPSYVPNPAGCPVGTIGYQLVYTGAGTTPSFVTLESSNDVRVTTSNNDN